MLKFIPQFSCWKLSPDVTFVICSCAKTHECILLTINTSGGITFLPMDGLMPDVRKMVPCRWQALSSIQRANIRQRFYDFLTAIYGEEHLGSTIFLLDDAR